MQQCIHIYFLNLYEKGQNVLHELRDKLDITK
jgi:hypothetical protein